MVEVTHRIRRAGADRFGQCLQKGDGQRAGHAGGRVQPRRVEAPLRNVVAGSIAGGRVTQFVAGHANGAGSLVGNHAHRGLGLRQAVLEAGHGRQHGGVRKQGIDRGGGEDAFEHGMTEGPGGPMQNTIAAHVGKPTVLAYAKAKCIVYLNRGMTFTHEILQKQSAAVASPPVRLTCLGLFRDARWRQPVPVLGHPLCRHPAVHRPDAADLAPVLAPSLWQGRRGLGPGVPGAVCLHPWLRCRPAWARACRRG